MAKSKQKRDEKIRNLFEDEGVKKIKFIELKSVLGILITACEFLGEEGRAVSRGLSIRSLKDGHVKKRCKNKAFGRAIKALTHRTNFYPIRNNIPKDEDLVDRTIRCKSEKEICDCEEILNFSIKNKPISVKDGKGYRVTISSLFPLFYAKHYFDYKSEYKPYKTVTTETE